MGLRIATNTASLTAQRSLQKTSQGLEKVYSRISSGSRITSASDDAAGLSISENLRAQIRSIGQAERNANDGISFVQVAEGGMNEINNMLIRLRELTIQAASDTIGDKERGFINEEFQQLTAEMDRIADVTNFNGTSLLNGQSDKSELQVQVGIRNNEADRINFSPADWDVRSTTLGIDGLNTTTVEDSRDAIGMIDNALSQVNGQRAKLGAIQNKLNSTVNNLGVEKENLVAARSRIADADIAYETSELTQKNILQSAGVSILAQANSAPMAALKLV